jgi:hypothetical protein
MKHHLLFIGPLHAGTDGEAIKTVSLLFLPERFENNPKLNRRQTKKQTSSTWFQIITYIPPK